MLLSPDPEVPLRVAICSTYPPRQCGLATFAADLAAALAASPLVTEVGIVTMERRCDAKRVALEDVSTSAAGVRLAATMDDTNVASYRDAARTVSAQFDVVIVQHEFGIFGGKDGNFLLAFLAALEIPYLITLHTVLAQFNVAQRAVLVAACANATTTMVFTSTARTLLIQQGIVDAHRVAIVPHGAPSALYGVDRQRARTRLALDSCFVLSSFGLVSEGKGLELAIEALALVIPVRPDAVLVIAGRTHPEVVRREGERYRDRLIGLAAGLGVDKRVRFVDGFLAIEDIGELLAATDIFVTPYVNEEQIVSGALTFALAGGCPVVSTPYVYAVDQLAGGAGLLVGSRDPTEFAGAVSRFALDDTFRRRAHRVASDIGKAMHWTSIGGQVAEICASARRRSPFALITAGNAGASPHKRREGPIPTTHLKRLVDDTGIIQHATGTIPLLASGYCVDDVARLVPVARALAERDASWGTCLVRSVSFLAHAHRPATPELSNFMDFDRRWLDEPHFGDHVGRALRALAGVSADEGIDMVAARLVQSLLYCWPSAPPLHPDAFALIGLSEAPGLIESKGVRLVAIAMLRRLAAAYASASRRMWCWPEARIRYDHGRFPHAMIAGGLALGDDDAVEVGLRSLDWYTAQCDHESFLRFPGHRGLAAGEQLSRSGDEQPLEAFAFLEAHRAAYDATADFRHRAYIARALDWFDGANRLGSSVGDSRSGAGADGVGSASVSRNCGAESTLAYVATRLAAERNAEKNTQHIGGADEPPRRSLPHKTTPHNSTKENDMLIGVRSSVTLAAKPDASALDDLQERNGATVTVIDLTDGRVRVESFSPIDCERSDVVGDLRRISTSQRLDLEALRDS